jgi:hypothetical protein
VIFSTHCDTVRGAASSVGPTGQFAGSCTYEFKWVKDFGAVTPGHDVTASCSLTTEEVITLVTLKRIEGWSQKIDYSPLKNTPPTCPVTGAEGKSFAYEHPTNDRNYVEDPTRKP